MVPKRESEKSSFHASMRRDGQSDCSLDGVVDEELEQHDRASVHQPRLPAKHQAGWS